MIETLHIQNFIIIDDVSVDFQDGFTVITGETGSGKSILLDALNFLKGSKANKSIIRPQKELLSVAAIFYLEKAHSLCTEFKEKEYLEDDESEGYEIVIRRTLNTHSRSKAYVNGHMISMGYLKEIMAQLLDIQGQLSQISLIHPKQYLSLLDQFGRLESYLFPVEEAYKKWQNSVKTLQSKQDEIVNLKDQEDFLKEQFEKLNTLSPEEGEEDSLKAEKQEIQDREKAYHSLQAMKQLIDHQDGVASQIHKLQNLSDQLSEDENWGELKQSIERLNIELSEIDFMLHKQGQSRFDQDRLSEIEDRLHLLKSIARRFHCLTDELPNLYSELKGKIEFLEDAEFSISQLEKQVLETKSIYLNLANDLHEAREKAAKKFIDAMHKELKFLSLPKVKFHIDVNALGEEAAHKYGLDQVEFMVSTNPGMPLSPLDKTASGGEISRFVLALRTVLNQQIEIPFLIFDEVDMGVSGAVANAMGQKMQVIAEHSQVLAVTHSPQIAALADHHFCVAKKTSKEDTIVKVRALSDEKRIDEIAKMLSAEKVTDEAKQTAAKLLQSKRGSDDLQKAS